MYIQEVKLRATQYLPDIIQLQNILYNLYNYKVDEEEVSKLTVKDLQDSVNGNGLLCLHQILRYNHLQI